MLHDESSAAQGISIVTVRSGREQWIVRAQWRNVCCPDWAPVPRGEGAGVGALCRPAPAADLRVARATRGRAPTASLPTASSLSATFASHTYDL